MAFHLTSQISVSEQTALLSSIELNVQAEDKGACHGLPEHSEREYEPAFLPLEASADLALLTTLCG